MERKICSLCNTENIVKSFYEKIAECEGCDTKRVLKCYYFYKDETLNQRNKIYGKKG